MIKILNKVSYGINKYQKKVYQQTVKYVTGRIVPGRPRESQSVASTRARTLPFSLSPSPHALLFINS